MGKNKEQKEENAPVFKLGIEKNVKIPEPQIIVQVEKELHNSIEDLIADNKAEIAYLKSRQREQELEIKNRHENVKRLQEQKKAIRREERERQKLYNTLKSDNIGLTKINVSTNKTSNYHPLVENVEPIIKSKQNQLVNQVEKNRLKNEYRASLFYPDDKEETKTYFEKQKQIEQQRKQEQKAQIEKQIEARNNVKTLPISDVEKTLFPDGNLAEMDFAKSKELGEKLQLETNELSSQFDVPLDKEMINIVDAINYLRKAKDKLSNEEMACVLKEKYFKNDNITSTDIKYLIQASKDLERHKLQNVIAVNFVQKDFFEFLTHSIRLRETRENLYMAKKEYYLNTPYAKEHQIFNNCYELEPRLRDYFIEKITQQIGADKLQTTKGIYINSNSQSSKELAKNAYLQKKVHSYINQIKKGQVIAIDRDMTFKKWNFYYAINNADILDLHINKQGNVDLLVVDTYDFNNDPDSSDLIKLAREHQDRGDLVPYFIIYHVELPISSS